MWWRGDLLTARCWGNRAGEDGPRERAYVHKLREPLGACGKPRHRGEVILIVTVGVILETRVGLGVRERQSQMEKWNVKEVKNGKPLHRQRRGRRPP